MLGIPSLSELKLLGAAVFVISVGAVITADELKIHSLKAKITDQASQISALTVENDNYKSAIVTLSQAKVDVEKKLIVASQTQQKIQQQLNTTLTQLSAQKPPTDCKAAIDWAVDQKDDLSWK